MNRFVFHKSKLRDTKPILDFIYVHGAGGSGKTTLARSLITCAGGVSDTRPCPSGAVVSYTPASVALVGSYRSATGGADGVQPYALVPKAIEDLLNDGYSVFCEGLMSPGVETCRRIFQTTKRYHATCSFIALDVSIEECTAHVIKRRLRKGNLKPYDNDLLVKKHRSVMNWVGNLKNAGIPASKMTWPQARDYCLRTFNLGAETVEGLWD